tara:strand:+ start:620 stop:805 length:186 start_codon:yes stop_codon:yes gene_type:complete
LLRTILKKNHKKQKDATFAWGEEAFACQNAEAQVAEALASAQVAEALANAQVAEALAAAHR